MDSETIVSATDELSWNIGYCDLILKIKYDSDRKLLWLQDYKIN